MTTKVEPEVPARKNVHLWGIFAVCLTVCVLALSLFAYKFGTNLSDNQTVWGEFGDFLGGVVNPLVGLATVFLLVSTLLEQKEELRAQREQLKQQTQETKNSVDTLKLQVRTMNKQVFEQSFFAWLSSYRELLASVEVPGRPTMNGRPALETFARSFSGDNAMLVAPDEGHEHMGSQADSNPKLDYEVLVHRASQGDMDAIDLLYARFGRALESYKQVYVAHRSSLDSLFRTLYRLFEWIERSDLGSTEKWHYSSLVRSQLSSVELLFLMYNGLTPNGIKFGHLMDRFALLDNLEEDADGMIVAFKRFFIFYPPELPGAHPVVWPYSQRAFSSYAAKRDQKVS